MYYLSDVSGVCALVDRDSSLTIYNGSFTLINSDCIAIRQSGIIVVDSFFSNEEFTPDKDILNGTERIDKGLSWILISSLSPGAYQCFLLRASNNRHTEYILFLEIQKIRYLLDLSQLMRLQMEILPDQTQHLIMWPFYQIISLLKEVELSLFRQD